jgi:5'-3' exonuclease
MCSRSDSDLLLFGLRQLFDAQKHVMVIKDETAREGVHYLVDLNYIKQQVMSNFPGQEQQEAAILRDFVFLAMFCGNDYIPKLHGA